MSTTGQIALHSLLALLGIALAPVLIKPVACIRAHWLRVSLLAVVIPFHFATTCIVALVSRPSLLVDGGFYACAGRIYFAALLGALSDSNERTEG
jgi:hypothetical protein